MVTMTYPRSFPIPMPTAPEMIALFEIVTKAFPKLATRYFSASDTDKRDFYFAFINAFECVASWRRLPELRTLDLTRAKHRVDTWADECAYFLKARGVSAQVGVQEFMLACIAAGDVDFVINRWPYDAFVNLTQDSDYPAATAAWKTVLTTKQTRAPFVPPALKRYA
jgi:hypothetical protein